MNLRKRKSNPNEPNAVHKLCYPKRIRLEQSNGLVLMDLPLMPLHLIISKLSPRHRVLLRCASKQLKVEYIDYVLHYYKSITHYLRRDSNNSAKYFVWQVGRVLIYPFHSNPFPFLLRYWLMLATTSSTLATMCSLPIIW